MEIIFNGRQTDVAARFRDLATAKLEKLEKLDHKAIRVDVEVSVERNPRQTSQKERVELTIWSRGPVIRAEAAAEDRFAALDMALAKLDSRLRRALDRRKRHHGGHELERAADRRGAEQAAAATSYGSLAQTRGPQASAGTMPGRKQVRRQEAIVSPMRDGADQSPSDSVVPIEMEGDGPLVVRQKFHQAVPIPIDQALLEMELVGHDFYLFHDIEEDMPSVVYRRHGYQYGVIRLVETAAGQAAQRAQAAGPQGELPAQHSASSHAVR